MALDLRIGIGLKQTQELKMTPQLQQAIKLLALSRMDLIDAVRDELMENPLLEENSELESPKPELKARRRSKARSWKNRRRTSNSKMRCQRTGRKSTGKPISKTTRRPCPARPASGDEPSYEATLTRQEICLITWLGNYRCPTSAIRRSRSHSLSETSTMMDI